MLNDNQIKDRINKAHGYITEEVVKKTLYSGRKVIEGEIGANGIDILTYKEDKDGNILNVRPYEIKYNTSPTGNTNSGEQGSSTWVNDKIEKLIKHFPDEDKYKKIHNYIKKNNPDTRLIRAIPQDNETVEFDISTLKSSDHKTSKINKLDGNVPHLRGVFNIINPKTEYEKKLSDIYKTESTKIYKERFPFLSDKDIFKLQKSISLKHSDIKTLQFKREIQTNNRSTINMGSESIEINSERLEEYLSKVRQFKEDILELNNDMHGCIERLQDDWDELGYEEFQEYFQDKVENRMSLVVDEIVENQMISKLNLQIEKHTKIENHKL